LIGENMVTKIIWFLNLRHSGTLFSVCFLTSAQQIIWFLNLSSWPMVTMLVVRRETK
jgi:hypothetical protein